jgi:HEAT repeat protein
VAALLTETLKDSSQSVRLAATIALGNTGNSDAVGPLIEVLSDANAEITTAAIRSIAKLEPSQPSLVQESLRAVANPSSLVTSEGFGASQVQGWAIQLLRTVRGRFPPKTVYFSELLYWPYWRIREQSATALGAQPYRVTDTAISRLYELRHDRDSSAICQAAEESLASILPLDTVEDY